MTPVSGNSISRLLPHVPFGLAMESSPSEPPSIMKRILVRVYPRLVESSACEAIFAPAKTPPRARYNRSSPNASVIAPQCGGLAPPLLFIRACKRFIATAPPTSHSIRRRVGSARRKQLIPHAHIKFLKTVASPLAFAPRMLYNISRAANGRTRSKLQSLHIVLM